MLQARHHKIISPMFRLYIDWILHRHFRKIEFIGDYPDKDHPVLLISNHTSWWDGFWNLHFTTQVLHRTFHVMVAEEQLRKYPFMNYLGAFSVKKGSRESVKSLRYACDLLTDPAHLVLIYPQGKIASAYQSSIRFQKGASYILRTRHNPVSLLFIAYFTETATRKRPSLWGYYQKFDVDADLEESYQLFYQQSLARHIQNTSE